MNISDETKKYLDEIISYLKHGNVVLFLGAGASKSVGAPLSRELEEKLKVRFPNATASSDFFSICQEVIDEYDRAELEDFIKKELEVLQPGDHYSLLVKYEWSAIFTTNYDDLIERAYRDPNRRKRCHSVIAEEPDPQTNAKEWVNLFKLMGCINNNMVLTLQDYINRANTSKLYYKYLFDYVKNGTIVYLGYSFNDQLANFVINQVRETFGQEKLRRSFALYHEKITNEKIIRKLSQNKIIPLECDFKSFLEYVHARYGIVSKDETINNKKIMIRNKEIEVSDEELKITRNQFSILNEDLVLETSEDKDLFFEGKSLNFGAFRNNWDFFRDIYIKEDKKSLSHKISQQLNLLQPDDNGIILITGAIGSGKSVLLKRIAYDIYTRHKLPAFIINTDCRVIDYRILDSIYDTINKKYLDSFGSDEAKPPLKVAIIIDNAGNNLRDVFNIKSYMSSRSKNVLVITAEREGELTDSLYSQFRSVPKENIFHIPDTFSDDEKQRFISYVSRLGYQTLSSDYLSERIKDLENSSFASFYYLIDPTRPSLEDKIKQMWLKLEIGSTDQKAYKYICLFSKYNLPMQYEQLARALKTDYDNLQRIIENISDFVFEYNNEDGTRLLKTTHRLIAEKTCDEFFSDPNEQYEDYRDIFAETLLSNPIECSTSQVLMTNYLGIQSEKKKFFGTKFSHEQQRNLFKVLCQDIKRRVIVHHWGLLEMEENNFEEAEELLRLALNLPKEDAYRGESDQSIITSLGTLYSYKAQKALEENNLHETKNFLDLASVNFLGARHGFFPNTHAYHAHANMGKRKTIPQKS